MVAAAPAIELAGLTRRYGERVALQDVSLTLAAGATLVVFGPNGHLYVSSPISDAVLEYNGTTGAFVKTFASCGWLAGPSSLGFGPSGTEPESAVLNG